MKRSMKRRSSSASAMQGDELRFMRTMGTLDWVSLCLIYLFTVSGVFVFGLTMVIQCILIDILERVLSGSPLRHHQRCARQASVPYGLAIYREVWRGVQSTILRYASSKCSVWTPKTEGLDHMATRKKLRDNLGKRRLHRKRELLIDEKCQHYSYPPCRVDPLGTSVPTENHTKQSNQNLEFSRIPSCQLSTNLYCGMSGQSDSVNGHPVTIHHVVGIMPRPGQPGALSFDGNKITDFIKDWNAECEEFALTDVQKCEKLPQYCDERIKESVKDLQGCVNGDWKLFQEELKELFWETDPPKNTITELVTVINDAKAGRIGVDLYVHKYTTITDFLVSQKAISALHRNVRLLEGLSEGVQLKVFERCNENKWRMIEHDVDDMVVPEFEEIKRVVLETARMFKKREMFFNGLVPGSGYAGSEVSEAPTTSTPPTVSTTITSPASTASGSLTNLSGEISKLTLFLGAQPQQQQPPLPKPKRQPRCHWCDGVEHIQQNKCSEFNKALNSGVINYNLKGRIQIAATGEELPLMTGKGGMKEALRSRVATAVTVSSAAALAPEDLEVAYQDWLADDWIGYSGESESAALKAVGVRQ
jgi:hypothetical protein